MVILSLIFVYLYPGNSVDLDQTVGTQWLLRRSTSIVRLNRFKKSKHPYNCTGQVDLFRQSLRWQ